MLAEDAALLEAFRAGEDIHRAVAAEVFGVPLDAVTSEQRGNATVINSMVPLANMFGYVNNLRSMSQGRAQYTMQFDHYQKVPQAVSDEVRAKLA